MTSAAVPQPRILLIDDDEFIAVSLRRYLTAQNWQVDVAADGASASALTAANPYAVIVVDPFLTGAVHQQNFIAIETIRQSQPDASLIVLTGYGSPGLARAARECRVTAVLRKPQSIVALSAAIASAMKH